jgi:SnoaL-like domain
MSQENVEVVRRWLAPMNSGDPEEVKAVVAELCDADVDYYPVRKLADTKPCHGRKEFSQFLAGWLEAWSRLEWAVKDLIEIGDDRVLVCANLRAEGRGSGMKLEGPIYQCEWLRHGRLFRIEDHLTLSGALHALGLEGATLEAAGLQE